MTLSETPTAVRDGLATPGVPLGDGVRTFMESRFHYDFSRVRIHSGRDAAESAEAMRALAYTVGRDVVFGTSRYRPETTDGQRLLAHELTHVVQQDQTNSPAVQRFEAEDAVVEMIGKTFTLSEDVTTSGITLAKGTSVVITAWKNENVAVTANVLVAGKRSAVTIEKKFLVPPRGSGLVQYTSGVKSARKSYTDLEAKIAAKKKEIAAWKLKQPSYQKNPSSWQSQMDRRQTELKDLEYKLTGAHYTPLTLPERLTTKVKGKTLPQTPRSKLLNKALIEETMFNAFDANVVKWVNHYHTTIGASKGWPKPDLNLIKSMLYQESHMGTFGQHLLPPPYTKGQRKTRFNIVQAIDSSGPQQILMIKEMNPALAAKHKIDDVMKDYYAAQKRWDDLTKKAASLSAAEQAELDDINSRSNDGDRWNDYFVTDPRWSAAVEEFFTEVTPARNLDYDFWIRTAVRWFYEKRKGESSWEKAVYAFNGAGARATDYKGDVIGRRDAAKAATGDFIPRQNY